MKHPTITAMDELAQDLYAVAVAGWGEQGRTAPYALVPAYDTSLVDAWFRLGFGLQHQHGVREPAAAPPRGSGSGGRCGPPYRRWLR